jgi:tetratricopeptide (TPR) repeat protein
MMDDRVKAWSERVTIPTYRIGAPDKNPMFLEKRVYQGSSGVVYPHPVIDRVFDERGDKEYTAVFLENRYLKIMILPEIGGRVQMALDKTNSYHFVYYNRVVKPALVGLTGPWISGGIEFNWPQHHRPSTFEPLDWRIDERPDGGATVWCAEIERMFRTKGMHGFTLYPDRAYLEISVQLYNRTGEAQTFLWWANPAVHVNDDYQSVFPPDVHAVMDHGKRDVADFPIATGTYYKVNYAPGTDISRYKNIPVPTSYMAYHSDFDFIGCYDHGRRAGMMHVANHHVVPGKKQWTWGNSDFGQAWDRQLTDADGPYIELMCGAYTDNQPDFSWIQPGEEKRFTQIFMPYKLIGPARNASREAVINLDVEGDTARIGVYVTRPRRIRAILLRDDTPVYEREIDLAPETALVDEVRLPAGTRPQALTLRVLDAAAELVSFTPLPDEKPTIPAPATPAPPPEAVASGEELFLHGLHLEQYRHATYAPEPYYEEALRRDPDDSRCNNALGLLLYRRGKFAEAEPYFRRAIRRLTLRNPNPYDGEPFYNLGLALRMQGRHQEAFDAFYKAVWNAAWQDAAYFELARLASRAGQLEEAIDLADRALSRNARHHQARHLKIALLRRRGLINAAHAVADESLALDRMEYGALWERELLAEEPPHPPSSPPPARLSPTRGQGEQASAAHEILPFSPAWERGLGGEGHAATTIELALDYAHAGLFDDAATLLRRRAEADPLASYTLGWVLLQAGEQEQAIQTFQVAAALPPDYCFPNRLEDVLALEAGVRLNPTNARAPYYLGNFWYAHRRYAEAIACWEQSRDLDSRFPTVHRNLGLAYYNKLHDPQRALQSLETAFALNPSDARVLFELDQLYKKLNRPPAERLETLERHADLVDQRDDLTIERITLLNLLGRPQEAFQLLSSRTFHPWEGGEGKVTGQYVTSLVKLARRSIHHGDYSGAISRLEQAQAYPHNLGEGKLYGAQENSIFYELGRAYAGLGETDRARAAFTRAATGLSEPTSPMYYNDQPPDMIFYQGLAREKLGRASEAQVIFRKLVDYGQAHINDTMAMDYFAVSLPDFLVFDEDLSWRNRIHCHYMMALGYTGLGERAQAETHYAEALRLDAGHLGATLHRRLLQEPLAT